MILTAVSIYIILSILFTKLKSSKSFWTHIFLKLLNEMI